TWAQVSSTWLARVECPDGHRGCRLSSTHLHEVASEEHRRDRVVHLALRPSDANRSPLPRASFGVRVELWIPQSSSWTIRRLRGGISSAFCSTLDWRTRY